MTEPEKVRRERTSRMTPIKSKDRTIIGWREEVGLPDLGLSILKVKVDTGARTSALHARVVGEIEIDGRMHVEFDLLHGPRKRGKRHVRPLLDRRAVKNTSGIPEDRYVIETLLVLGKKRWPIEVTLADRKEMKFDMILGRTAIRGRHLLVDSGKSYLAGKPVI